MTETPKEDGNGIQVPIPFLGGKINVKGAAAILAVMIAGLGYWTYDQVKMRDAEMDHIRDQIEAVDQNGQKRFNLLNCKVDLAIYVHQFPKGAIDWNALPSGFYECLPNLKPKQ